MVAYTPGQRLTLPIAPLVAGLLGFVAAGAAALAPTPLLETLVSDSGLPGLIPAAEPPLGATAHALVAFGMGALVAIFAGLGLFLLLGTRAVTLRKGEAEESDAVPTPVVRRADAHPDAPPRPPLLATRDLGTPFRETAARHHVAEVEEMPIMPVAEPAVEVAHVPAERALPADLDQPLAAFDPWAIPETPLPAASLTSVPVRRKPAPVFAPGERFEVFELLPPIRPEPVAAEPAPVEPVLVEPVRPEPVQAAAAPNPLEMRLAASVLAEKPEPIAAPETDATIHALLERLERGVARRRATPASATRPTRRSEAEHGLQEALASLRQMAMRA